MRIKYLKEMEQKIFYNNWITAGHCKVRLSIDPACAETMFS